MVLADYFNSRREDEGHIKDPERSAYGAFFDDAYRAKVKDSIEKFVGRPIEKVLYEDAQFIAHSFVKMLPLFIPKQANLAKEAVLYGIAASVHAGYEINWSKPRVEDLISGLGKGLALRGAATFVNDLNSFRMGERALLFNSIYRATEEGLSFDTWKNGANEGINKTAQVVKNGLYLDIPIALGLGALGAMNKGNLVFNAVALPAAFGAMRGGYYGFQNAEGDYLNKSVHALVAGTSLAALYGGSTWLMARKFPSDIDYQKIPIQDRPPRQVLPRLIRAATGAGAPAH